MASIRRTASPVYHNRPYDNVLTPFLPSSISSTSHNGSSKHSSSLFLSYLTKLSGAVSDPKISRRCGCRQPFYHFLVFFLLGFLLGMTLYGRMEEVNSTDRLSFEIKQPHVEERLNDGKEGLSGRKRKEAALVAVSFVAETVIGKNKMKETFDFLPRKLIIVVTPTYNRAMQAYYLNRLAQTLRLVQPPLLWLVVEGNAESFETAEILRKTGVMYRHLVCKKNMTSIKDRRVHQRNTALEHIELHNLDGIVYFADDDNVYSLELFLSL